MTVGGLRNASRILSTARQTGAHSQAARISGGSKADSPVPVPSAEVAVPPQVIDFPADSIGINSHPSPGATYDAAASRRNGAREGTRRNATRTAAMTFLQPRSMGPLAEQLVGMTGLQQRQRIEAHAGDALSHVMWGPAFAKLKPAGQTAFLKAWLQHPQGRPGLAIMTPDHKPGHAARLLNDLVANTSVLPGVGGPVRVRIATPDLPFTHDKK